MSKLSMQGHFRYLSFKTFPMTPITPQFKVFCPLLLSSEHSGVPEDSKSQLFQVLGFTPTLGQSRGATSTYTIDRMEVFSKDLNLGLQCSCPLPLPSIHLIWFETNLVMIVFNTFFIPNVLQKLILTIIIFLILSPSEKNLSSI